MQELSNLLKYSLAIGVAVLLVACNSGEQADQSAGVSGAWPAELTTPIGGATFSLDAIHLPGAPRDYRAGIHQGFDFSNGYSGRIMPPDAAAVAVAPGEIIRIDQGYTDPGTPALEYWAGQADDPGFPGEYALDQLRGRQVWIRHESGHVSRYGNLSAVHPELGPGSKVEQGQPVGKIGTSGQEPAGGAQDPAPQLHFELWSSDGTRHLCQDAAPLDCHRQLRTVFGAEALPRYVQGVLERVDEGEPAPDPYPPEELPETGFSLDPPATIIPGRPFAVPVTWEGNAFQPGDFFAQLAGRPLGIIDAGNGAWLLGALPLEFEESQTKLIAGAADVYGQTMLGSQAIEVRPRENELDAIEVSEAVMTAHNDRDAQNETRALVEAGLRSLDTSSARWTTPFHAPLESKVTRRFGQKIFHGLLRSAYPLPGVIIEAEPGDAVSAANAGRVVGVIELPVRGNTVLVDHGGGVISVYANLAEASVTEGDEVRRGQTLGLAGDSGAADETQVRWEIHVAGTPTDPLEWHQEVLPNRQTSSPK